jgi:hypothetical protein
VGYTDTNSGGRVGGDRGFVVDRALPQAFAQVPDLLARFTREARVLASLNHPNIAAIWSPDGRTIVFDSDRHGHADLYRKASDGTGGGAEEVTPGFPK